MQIRAICGGFPIIVLGQSRAVAGLPGRLEPRSLHATARRRLAVALKILSQLVGLGEEDEAREAERMGGGLESEASPAEARAGAGSRGGGRTGTTAAPWPFVGS